MATTTLKRQQQPQKTSNWSAIFPTEQVTEQQSALFVKKLLAVAISNITYLRTIFPEHAFGDRCLEDLSLKILRDDSACPGACQVIQWVKGCFDALDKKYLRTIIVGIYIDANDPSTVVETYTFKFDYDSKTGITIFRNGDKVASAFTEAETRKATIKLLRTVVVLTQTLRPLPDDVMMTMKLYYFDDVTPLDYEPPGFKSSPPEEDFQFKEEPVNIKVGDVMTAFHCVKLRICTDSKQFDMVESKEDTDLTQNQDTTQEKGMVPALKSKTRQESQKELARQTQFEEKETSGPCESGVSVEPQSVDQAVTMNSYPTPTNNNVTPEEDNTVRCPCGCNEDDGLMVLCGKCKVWQHAVCYGLLQEHDVPELHVCEQCAQSDNGCQCTDPFLQFLNPVALQATCLWRRALSACVEFSRILTPQFARRLGVEMSVAQGLVNRLEREGFVKAPAKGKRLGRMVNKPKIRNEGIRKYFEKPEDQCIKVESSSPAGQAPSKNSGLEQVTEDTSSLNISQGTSKRKPPGKSHEHRPPHLVGEEVRRSPRLLKRARSTVDENVEFDLSCSQDPDVSIEQSQKKRRKKASIAARSILV